MPQRFLFTLFIIFIQIQLWGQTTIWSDDFNPPQNWQLDDHWWIDEGYMRFDGFPVVNDFDFSTVSPVISLGEHEHELIIKQRLEVFEYAVTTEKSEISIITGDEEVIVWSYELAEGSWGQNNGTNINFDISDYAGQDIQFRFHSYGPSTNAFFYWDIYDLAVSAMLNNDLSIVNVTGPASIDVLTTGNWSVSIQNNAIADISDFQVKFYSYKSGELLGSIDDPETISPLEIKSYDFSWTPNAAHNTFLYALIVNDGDEYVLNNSSKGKFLRINPDIECDILVWDSDNDIPSIVDPEKGDVVQPSAGLERAIGFAGLEYDLVNDLPDDLYNYEMIFSTMGCFCLS